MSENMRREEIKEFSKFCSKSGSQEICVWGIDYKYQGEWYDLFEDPPEWAIDVMVTALNKYSLGYQVKAIWSEEDQEFVGLCDTFPSLSFMSPNYTEALEGIIKLIKEINK